MEVRPGTLDALILRGLSWGPKHGYAVARWIEESSHHAFVVLDGALYTALHRMQERGWIAGEWGTSPMGRRVKLYRLTPDGREQLKAETLGWNEYVQAIARVMRTRTQPGAI